jgi:hypothetical protein
VSDGELIALLVVLVVGLPATVWVGVRVLRRR